MSPVILVQSGCTAGLAAILIAAGAAKAVDLQAFTTTVSKLIPAANRQSRSLAEIIVGVEITTGLALSTEAPFISPWVYLLSVTLAAAFVVANVYAICRHVDVECRCFGALRASRFGLRSLSRASATLFLAIVALTASSVQLGSTHPTWAESGLLLVLYGLFGIGAAQASVAMSGLRVFE
jgi:methylamine utilization protein MauE